MKAESQLKQDIEEVILSEEHIAARVREIAAQITRDYAGKEFVMVGVLNGAAIFYINLIMELDIPLEMNFIRVSSYGAGTKSSGNVRMLYDLEADIAGKDVLIVEDILDTGITLSNLVPMLKMRNPNSVKICTILDKPSRRKADIAPDYEGFAVPDEFVVGYGLDYDEKYRNLPYIGVLKPSVYEK